MGYRLGIDIGGTFTDFVAYDEGGKALRAWKNMSTPANPIEGILTGLRTFGATGDIGGMRLGTTVATNALLEGKGATVAYVTTRGFKDVPFIGRGNRRHHYDLAWVKPKPFVQRRNAFEIDERVGPSGETIQPLDEKEVRTLARAIKAEGEVSSIAVVLLHSYLTPDHEQRMKEILRKRSRICRCRSRMKCCRSGRSISGPRRRSATPSSSPWSTSSLAACAMNLTSTASAPGSSSCGPTAAR